MSRSTRSWLAISLALLCASVASAQQAGSIRGLILDEDFEAPLPGVSITISETQDQVTSGDDGNFVIPDVPPGTYTLIFSKDGFTRQLRPDVVVTAGRLTEANVSLAGDFTDMDEFVVEELQVGGATEAGLLRLRFQSPALLDSIGADFISRAGASDAAAALRLVSGATVQDGKFAVVRGLPDRYVSTQLNGIRLPSADEDKRAVELDQFPSPAIESIQVAKTFTPDQQGDASGGAVNIILRGIPAETSIRFKGELGFNTQVQSNRDRFLTYEGGGLSYWGRDGGSRDPQPVDENWLGAVGTSEGKAPIQYKWALDGGGRIEFEDGVTVGGFASVFYERDAVYYTGVDNSLWVTEPGGPLVPETVQGVPSDGDFKTQLFDITRGVEGVRWGTLGTGGVETENHSVGVTYLYTSLTEDSATLAVDTRGKDYFFPGYDPNDPTAEGNEPGNLSAAPYLRTQTLEYTERTTETLAFNGNHTIPIDEWGIEDVLMFQAPRIDWTYSNSTATFNQPDKRQFGVQWVPESENPGAPPFVPPFTTPPTYSGFKPDAVFTLGNLQRLYKFIQEDSDQFFVNLTLPFEQWTGDEGFVKVGIFDDEVERTFVQQSFSNFNDNSSYEADFDQFWSSVFPDQDHPISDGPPFVDVNYDGKQIIRAWYAMADVPLNSQFSLLGGARVESTDISIVNFPEEDATWFPPGAISPVRLNPGDADVSIDQNDVLPALAFTFRPVEEVTFRGSWTKTIARPVFKELTPIQQQEFLGGDIFIGNPDLQISSLENWDLRLDYAPYEGGLISVSWFYKNITNPIENVQRVATFTYTTPVNYPRGTINGFEFELRQDIGYFVDELEGLAVGGNVTLINSQVTLPDDEAAMFASPAIQAPITSRDMTNAPDYLYNLYVTYDRPDWGTSLGLFYTVKGDTLLAGAGVSDGNFVPSVYADEFGTLNLTISQMLGEYLKLTFKAKNLTNPAFTEVYRSPYIGNDVTKRAFKLGIDFSIALSAQIPF